MPALLQRGVQDEAPQQSKGGRMHLVSGKYSNRLKELIAATGWPKPEVKSQSAADRMTRNFGHFSAVSQSTSMQAL
jgi:hypothetical protein